MYGRLLCVEFGTCCCSLGKSLFTNEFRSSVYLLQHALVTQTPASLTSKSYTTSFLISIFQLLSVLIFDHRVSFPYIQFVDLSIKNKYSFFIPETKVNQTINYATSNNSTKIYMNISTYTKKYKLILLFASNLCTSS